jgi:GH25 family lysozyme M1 (1,4-beta-N-acetylmuramidase)
MTVIADTNEFHPLVDAVAYRDSREADGTNHPIIIMRATYSNTHVDFAYVRNIRAARAAGLYVGHYGYMVANVDAAAQGNFFGQIMTQSGGYKLGDSIWCDDEEGSGDQTGRAEAWLAAAHKVLRDHTKDEGVYSGVAFWQAHLGSLPSGPNRWVAAYGQSDPHLASEDLWQFSDNRTMTGISGPCDASIYMGNTNDWLRMIGAKSSPSQPPSDIFLEDSDMQQVEPASRLAFTWPDGAKTIRFVTDAPAGSELPVHIAWFTADKNWKSTVVVGTVTEPDIPGGRGCMIHRDDAADSETAKYQLGVVAST